MTTEYLHHISQQTRTTARITSYSQDYPKQSHQEADDGLISNISTGNVPTDSHDDASLAVGNDCAGHWAHLRNDEELRNVDQGCKDARLHDPLAKNPCRDVEDIRAYHEN